MTQIVSANEITLNDLQRRFQLNRSTSDQFFTEWLENLPDLASYEKDSLDRVQQNYLDQFAGRSMIEETVKLVIVSPLLDLAGFYRQPFQIDSEISIQLEVPNDETGTVIRGRIDTLVVQGCLWVTVVESKRTRFSVHSAIPQLLTYLLSSPHYDQPVYGLITNGAEFIFVKLVKQPAVEYDLSNTFSVLNRGNELYRVLQVLQQIRDSFQANQS